jgi:hypothetical protein
VTRIHQPGWTLHGIPVQPVKLHSDGMWECKLLESEAQYRAGDSVWVHQESLEVVE